MNISRKIEKVLGNNEALKKMSEENHDNYKLALDYLDILNNEENYEKINEILNYWFNTSDRYLVEMISFITPDLGTDNYKALLEKALFNCNKFELYTKLRTFIDDESAKKIRDKIKSAEVVHKINIHEKWYDDALKFIRKMDFYNYKPYLKDIEKIYPEEAWKIHEKYVNYIMENDRNRRGYTQIAETLKTMKNLRQNETLNLINILYNHKPNLPALKDEFKRAGII